MPLSAWARPVAAARSRRSRWPSTCAMPRLPITPGQQPQDMPVAPDGRRPTLPRCRFGPWEQAILLAGLPGAVSYSAGTFVCNDLLYSLLHACQGTGILAGFIHVPYLPQQAEKIHAPSLTLEQMVQALIAAILALP